MRFLYDDDKNSISITSDHAIYFSAKDKILIFAIEAYREERHEMVEMPEYKKFVNMINSFKDVKFYFSTDDSLDFKSVSFDKNTHFKDGVNIVTVKFK